MLNSIFVFWQKTFATTYNDKGKLGIVEREETYQVSPYYRVYLYREYKQWKFALRSKEV